MTSPWAKVRMMATDGSIAGIGPHRLDYSWYSELGQHLIFEQMLARVPEAQEIAYCLHLPVKSPKKRHSRR
jgi:hypothetical protein